MKIPFMMFPRFVAIFFLTYFLLAPSLLPQALPQLYSQEANERYVVMVSLDGLAAFLLDDPNASLPVLRQMAKTGAVARGGMRVSNPSVTWPNHTTLISGVQPTKHGVLANGVLVRGGPGVPIVVDPKRDRADLVRVPTLVDYAHERGMRIGEINWPCTRGSAAYDDSFPDVPESLLHSTPRLMQELVDIGLLKSPDDKSFYSKSGAARDWIWTEAACHLIRQRQPHLLLVHLLNVDSVHHTYGAQTPAGYSANAYIDQCLSRIVEATKVAGTFEKTTFVVVSDHGFISTPKIMKPNVILRDAGMLKTDGNRIVEARVHVFPEGGIGLVYCTNPGEAPELRNSLKELFDGKEGVAEFITPDRFLELGLPLPREYEQAPDAILAAAEGYAVSASVVGDSPIELSADAKTSLGSHGYLSTNPKMNGMCVLWGRGIQAGVELVDVDNTSIAPTIAKLLALESFPCDGKPLDQALSPSH